MNTISEAIEPRGTGVVGGASSRSRLQRPRLWEGLLATTLVGAAADIGAAKAQKNSPALPPVQIDAPRQRPAAKPRPKPAAVLSVGRRAPRVVATPHGTPPAG